MRTTPLPFPLAPFESLTRTLEDATGEADVATLLARIVEGACALIGADDGTIGLYCADDDTVRTAASFNTPAGAVRAFVRRGEGLIGRVLELDRAVYGRYGDLPRPLRSDALDQQALGVPIHAADRLIGVFCVGVSPPRHLAADAPALLALYARHAAIAIVSAQRYADEHRRASRFALIARIAALASAAPEVDQLLQRTADAIHELLDFENVDIPLIDADDPHTLVIRIRGGHYKQRIHHVDRMPVGTGIMGDAAARRATQLVNDVARDPRYVTPPGVDRPRAELAVPIVHGDDLLGVLNVEGNVSFDDLDRISLETIAEYLAMAIANARLFDAARDAALLRDRHHLARDLHDSVTQILSSMNLLTQSLTTAWREDPDVAARRVDRLGELARLGLAEMRALLQKLSPDASAADAATPSFDVRARRMLSAMVPPSIEMRLRIDALPGAAARHEDGLLRFCQEAVSNAVRHGAPATIAIRIGPTRRGLRIAVIDDGRGIADGSPRGMGLLNMRQRVAEMGGRLRVARGHRRGAIVVAWIDL